MTWVKLDDGFSDHPRIEGLSDKAFRLHVAGLCFCGRTLSNGFIPDDRVRRLLPKVARATVDELVRSRLWSIVDGGFEVKDFLEFNPTADQVKERRKQTRERQERWRNASRNASSGTRPRPVPTRPEGSRGGFTGLPSAVVSSPAPSGGDDNVVRLRCDVCGGRGVVLLDCGDAVDCECKRRKVS